MDNENEILDAEIEEKETVDAEIIDEERTSEFEYDPNVVLNTIMIWVLEMC